MLYESNETMTNTVIDLFNQLSDQNKTTVIKFMKLLEENQNAFGKNKTLKLVK